MLIAIVSDSHDNLQCVQAFNEYLETRGADLILHAGDIVAPFTAKAFAASALSVHAVFGNCDGEKSGLKDALGPVGSIQKPPLIKILGGRKIFMVHDLMRWGVLINSVKPDVIIHGHTHRQVVSRVEGQLILNPGELGGNENHYPTFLFLNTETMDVEPVTLEV